MGALNPANLFSSSGAKDIATLGQHNAKGLFESVLSAGLGPIISTGKVLTKTNPVAAIPMADPNAIALQQRLLAARQAASAGGRASTILSQQSDSGDRLGP